MRNSPEIEIESAPAASEIIIENSIPKRNTGIDALRLLSMFFIVMAHILGQGGVLANTAGMKNDIARLLEVISCCAVNIYAIISGYVGYTDDFKPFRTSKYLSMWLQVFCYSFGITLIVFLLRLQYVSLRALAYSLFPVTTKQYWYFTAFTGVYLLKPWFNRFIRALTEKELTVSAVIIFLLFSVYSTFAKHLGLDAFILSDGYSMLWIALLYIIGAWLKKCGVADTIGNKTAMLVLIGCTVITWGCRQFAPPIIRAGVLFPRVSPTMVCIAISYVIIFSKLRNSGSISKIVAFFAPAAFGAYLLHAQPIIFECYLPGAFAWIGGAAAWLLPILVVGATLAVFVLCIFIEKLRLFLFKLLRIDALVVFAGDKIDRMLDKIQNALVRFFKVSDET